MIAPDICGNPTESFTGKAGSCKKSTPQDSTAAQAGQGFMRYCKITCINISKNALTAYALMHNLCLKPVRHRQWQRQR
jgi:hypothetical protein